MAVHLHTLTFILVNFCSFGEGQKYFSTATDDFYADQQKILNPTLSTSFHQSDPLLPGGFFSPARDLETSDLPSHLQQTLPQYQHQRQSFLQEPPRFRPSVPGPFKLAEEYVRPSTYKPHYPHVLHQQQNYYQKFSKNDVQVEAGTPRGADPVLSNHHGHAWAKDGTDNQVDDAHFSKRESADDQRLGRDKDDSKSLGESPESEDNDADEEEYDDDDADEYDEEYQEENEEEPNNDETHEVLTKEGKFHEFADVDSLDTTTQEPSTANRPPVALEKQSFPHSVVSVVTSKTIVNNTIVSSPGDAVTESSGAAVAAAASNETSTDSWIVIASVQTSRSISGAHFIPSSEVNQSEEKKMLNDVGNAENAQEDDDRVNSEVKATTPLVRSSPHQKVKTSTESLIDKLDRVQSDLSSSLLTGGYKNGNIAVIKETPATMTTETAAPELPDVPSSASTKKYPQVKIKSFDASNRLSSRERNKNNSARKKGVLPAASPALNRDKNSVKNNLDSVLEKSKPVDISAFLPPGYKLPSEPALGQPLKSAILSGAKPVDDVTALPPPGYQPPQEDDVESEPKPVDVSAVLPPAGPNPNATVSDKAKPVADISSLLPPGYKPPKVDTLSGALSALLPSGYGPLQPARSNVKTEPVAASSSVPTDKSGVSGALLAKAKPVDDISALLPPGYKGLSRPKSTTQSSVRLETVRQSIPAGLLPPGYKPRANGGSDAATASPVATTKAATDSSPTTTSKAIKLIFPSRPGGGARKSPRPTGAKANEDANKPSVPTIHKGWPSRATTEFTGWPTPSTTPISIEKLLEAARAAATSTTAEAETRETTSSTTTTTTTTTTPRPTTPGICDEDCDLEGTVKLIGSKAQWVPELLDRNTKEYQLLENSVRTELENIYRTSPVLKRWYDKIRIDAFSEGSILVDYVVEFDNLPRKIDTREIKRHFHETLGEISAKRREGKALNDTTAEKFTLGEFQLDPKYTEFIVRPKSGYNPTDGLINEDALLPQWAIAVIVIGLASLLFVIIFGVTVLINRHRNSKKNPTPLTEDMLNDLNKSHMGGYDNYNHDDFYNMEDVWSDPPHFEEKSYKRRHHGSSLYGNSAANLYGSWGSDQWDGQKWNDHKNNYYSAANSHCSGRSAYARGDTDF